MQALTTLVSSFSTLLWPLIAIAVLVVFGPPLVELIQSAKSRKFTLKIGGQELSMDEATEQQGKLIADLQSQVAEIKKSAGTGLSIGALATASQTSDRRADLSSVLWIDDSPKNNSYFINELETLGLKVDLALTTSEGLSKLGNRRYSVVISDMGRHEDGAYNPDAGIDLLKAIRSRDPQVPFFIFCSARGVQEHHDEAMRSGANGITASASELYALLNLEQLKKHA